ncbi:MAG: nucleoside hydrolase [Candidatus Saganbacteria bacterium]|nr:nucleoside hydrolase [Candidatus Saganbacteria bacterium]
MNLFAAKRIGPARMLPRLALVTDVLEDIDDAEAVTLAASKVKQEQLSLSGVVTTYMIPDIRDNCVEMMLANLAVDGVPTSAGSALPSGETDRAVIDEYVEAHVVNKKLFEELGLLQNGTMEFSARWEKPADLIHHLIEDAKGHLNIGLIAPATDLALAIQMDRKHFEEGVDAIYISGQAEEEGGGLVPNFAAHNLNVDQEASQVVFSTQEQVAFTLLGKWAAYQTTLYDTDFELFAKTGHPVGQFLKRSAELGMVRLCGRNVGKFSHLYVDTDEFDPADPLKYVTRRSHPYDPLALMALTDPELFDRSVKIGRHTIIGATEDNPGMSDPLLVKRRLIEDILFVLS